MEQASTRTQETWRLKHIETMKPQKRIEKTDSNQRHRNLGLISTSQQTIESLLRESLSAMKPPILHFLNKPAITTMMEPRLHSEGKNSKIIIIKRPYPSSASKNFQGQSHGHSAAGAFQHGARRPLVLRHGLEDKLVG